MAADDQDDPESTIVRRGKDAFLLAEMGRFARDLQARPLEKLVEDLPGLLELPDSKYAPVAMTVGKRMRVSTEERAALEAPLRVLQKTGSDVARKRADALLNPP